MLLRKVPNTEENEKMDHRFDFSVNDSLSKTNHIMIIALFVLIVELRFSCIWGLRWH